MLPHGQRKTKKENSHFPDVWSLEQIQKMIPVFVYDMHEEFGKVILVQLCWLQELGQRAYRNLHGLEELARGETLAPILRHRHDIVDRSQHVNVNLEPKQSSITIDSTVDNVYACL